MEINLAEIGKRLKAYRHELQLSLEEVSSGTGIPIGNLESYEKGNTQPSGDEILIFADFFNCDYQQLISNIPILSFEKLDAQFRRKNQEFSKSDRRAIAEFLFLCENEAFMLTKLGRAQTQEFVFTNHDTYKKRQGKHAAARLREHLGYSLREVHLDVFREFRKIGCRIFRRRLGNSSISGLFIRHPVAGNCILVNFDEDIYRQRFTVTHEVGHAILDTEQEMSVSFVRDKSDHKEVRANNFASSFLVPPDFLRSIPEPTQWNKTKILQYSELLKVNVQVLRIALVENKLLADVDELFKDAFIPKESKSDPELPENLSPNERGRRSEYLQRGLSSYYVNLCFDAYHESVISSGRLAEVLLVKPDELAEIAQAYGRSLSYDD